MARSNAEIQKVADSIEAMIAPMGKTVIAALGLTETKATKNGYRYDLPSGAKQVAALPWLKSEYLGKAAFVVEDEETGESKELPHPTDIMIVVIGL